MIIAHVSDLHFGTELPEVVEGLRTRLLELGPDLVVASGDFTMAARRREYARARSFLSSLPCRVLATPGNHDMPVYNPTARFCRPFRRYRRSVGSVTVDRFVSDEAALLALNSARPWDLSLDWSHGRLSARQIDLADRWFGEHAGARFKALVVHHPFYVPEDLPGFRTIRRGEAMLGVLARHRVDAILTGHLHRQMMTRRRLPLTAGSHEIAMLQVATATSSRHREQPNAFAVIRVYQGGFGVDDEVWDGARFVPSDGAEAAAAARSTN